MNILVVGGMYPPMRTGTAFYTRNMALALKARGHSVTVLTQGEPDPADHNDGLDVRRLPAMRLPMAGFFKHYQLCAFDPRNWLRARRIAHEVQADAILLVNHYLDIAFPAAFAAWSRAIPLVCSVGTQLQSLDPRRNRILNMLDRLVCGMLVFPRCQRIVAWDTQIRQYLEDVQGPSILDKTVIVNYGVNGDSSHLLARQHDYQARHVILGVGAVSEQRSFVPLVRAFALLASEFPQLHLRIVGHVYFDAAPRLAAELGLAGRVEFLGEQSHERVVEEMHNADLFFSSLTGKYVGLGTAAIEAMLLSVPTVVNTPLDLLGTGMLIDGEHLIQCRQSEPEAIAANIRKLLADAGLRQRVGLGGRAFVRQYLNWEVVARDMEQVLLNAAVPMLRQAA